uniref:Uncharacterized protein n=1 Tax=Kalanchoe fedtschenkoi TaxID=63787 RepID=A0A7N0T033_KALFE
MGNCCSDRSRGRNAAIGGASTSNGINSEAVDEFAEATAYNSVTSWIELSLSASNLRDQSVFTKCDSMVVLYTKRFDGSIEELGRTEIQNSVNPVWNTKHAIIYHFEVLQTLLFRVFDVGNLFQNLDVKNIKLDELQCIGEGTCLLSEIIAKPNRMLTVDLICKEENSIPNQSHNSGKLSVRADEPISVKTLTELTLRCSDLEYTDLFSRSEPFLVISNSAVDGKPVPICKTEIMKNDLKPTWKPIYLNVQQAGSKDTPLIIECFNFNSNGKHDLVGKVQKSLADLEKLHSSGLGENLTLPTPVGQHYQNKILDTKLFVDKFIESTESTFLDYLAAGFEFNLMVAIDFTASNGNPRLPDSLHYIDPSGRPNVYQKVVLEVGEVLQVYDSDKRFPAWGFGARPIDGPVSHCFNLNGSSNYCEVNGIQGIMMAYQSALFNVSLAGPTLFGHVITSASVIASQALGSGQQKYFVLLIITDGVITDLQETKDAIVKASDLPLSILIVGVGGADFKEMEILDPDKSDRLESSTGHVATRHIVQFVPFRDVQNGGTAALHSLLSRLPSQFLTYARTRDIHPKLNQI